MNPEEFSMANAKLVAEGCSDLPVHRAQWPDGSTAQISKWKPTKEELEEINRTGVVWLFMFGTQHPPVAVSGHDPFG